MAYSFNYPGHIISCSSICNSISWYIAKCRILYRRQGSNSFIYYIWNDCICGLRLYIPCLQDLLFRGVVCITLQDLRFNLILDNYPLSGREPDCYKVLFEVKKKEKLSLATRAEKTLESPSRYERYTLDHVVNLHKEFSNYSDLTYPRSPVIINQCSLLVT